MKKCSLCLCVLSLMVSLSGVVGVAHASDQMAENFKYYTLEKRVNPEYPRRALRSGREGYVVVEFNVTPEGEVVNPVVIESSPKNLFERAALKAIKQWQYKADFGSATPDAALARTKMMFALSN